MFKIIDSEEELINYISCCSAEDAIVVEGYEGVGKGRVLNLLSEQLSVIPYRPDYNLWQKYDHRNIDRWKISGFFWDVYSHFNKCREAPSMLFDRGVLSGAVYNNDMQIAEDYKYLLRDSKVLHILVMCANDEDYEKFQEVRGLSPEDIEGEKKKYHEYSNRYIDSFEIAGISYILYKNHYSPTLAKRLSRTCEGCGHYNYGYCRHPAINSKVDKSSDRCSLSNEKEVQDRDVAEMYSM